jgi:Ca2+/Na+ antiporter
MGITTVLGAIVIIVGVILFFLASRKTTESNNISKFVPMDNINSIPFGIPVVVNGTVSVDQPLVSPFTKKPCVYFAYTLEKESEIKEKNGNSSWEWKQVGSSQLQTIPFYLQDQTGKILIKPENCEVNGIYETQQFLQPGTIQAEPSNLKILADAFQFGSPNNDMRGNRERITEYTILTGSQVNAFGIPTMEGEQKFIQKTNEYPLILSPLSKDQLVGSEKKAAFMYYGFGITLILLGLFLAFYG